MEPFDVRERRRPFAHAGAGCAAVSLLSAACVVFTATLVATGFVVPLLVPFTAAGFTVLLTAVLVAGLLEPWTVGATGFAVPLVLLFTATFTPLPPPPFT